MFQEEGGRRFELPDGLTPEEERAILMALERLPHRRRGRRSPRRRSARPAGAYAPRRDGRTGRMYVRGSLGPVKVAFHVDQLWASVPGGIGTYTRQLLTALPAEDPSTELV